MPSKTRIFPPHPHIFFEVEKAAPARFANTNKIMTKILPGPAQYFAWNVDGKYHIFSEIYFHLGTFVMNTISQLLEFILGLGTSLTVISES